MWLIPKEPARSSIQKAIDRHSSEQKTANFRAHVTLIAGLEPEGGEAEVIAKAESLALKLGAISARVERTACMDLYFKSVSFAPSAGLFNACVHVPRQRIRKTVTRTSHMCCFRRLNRFATYGFPLSAERVSVAT